MLARQPDRTVRWENWEGTSREHLVLWQDAGGITVESAIIGEDYAARYRVTCDPHWHLRRLDVDVLGRPPFLLQADGKGAWTDGDGHPLPALDGALDIDLPASPFTNTLPVQRLKLQPGQSADIVTAYVIFPDLSLQADPQRYTCIDQSHYRYDSRDSDFTAEITVDADGLVIDYPGLFRRIP